MSGSLHLLLCLQGIQEEGTQTVQEASEHVLLERGQDLAWRLLQRRVCEWQNAYELQKHSEREEQCALEHQQWFWMINHNKKCSSLTIWDLISQQISYIWITLHAVQAIVSNGCKYFMLFKDYCTFVVHIVVHLSARICSSLFKLIFWIIIIK